MKLQLFRRYVLEFHLLLLDFVPDWVNILPFIREKGYWIRSWGQGIFRLKFGDGVIIQKENSVIHVVGWKFQCSIHYFLRQFFHKLFGNLSHCFDFFTHFKFLWIVRLFWSNSNRSPDCQSSILRSSAFRWSFHLLSFEGFCRSKLGIIINSLHGYFLQGWVINPCIKQFCQLVDK